MLDRICQFGEWGSEYAPPRTRASLTLTLLFDEPQGPVSERHRAFFFGSCRSKRRSSRQLGLVAETRTRCTHNTARSTSGEVIGLSSRSGRVRLPHGSFDNRVGRVRLGTDRHGCWIGPAKVGSTPTGVSLKEDSSKVCRRWASGARHPTAVVGVVCSVHGLFEGDAIHHLVSSVGRAPDHDSGSRGFDSRTKPQAENLLPYEGNRRESATRSPRVADGRWVGRAWATNVSAEVTRSGSTDRRYAVRGYRFHARGGQCSRNSSRRSRSSSQRQHPVKASGVRSEPTAQTALRARMCDRAIRFAARGHFFYVNEGTPGRNA